ncbi:MAG: hypothetical protein D6785_02495, partial [Planctomycetota bacterium]
ARTRSLKPNDQHKYSISKSEVPQIIQTLDGTYTAYSDTYKEAYHTLDGALMEARIRYYEGCQIPQKLTGQNRIYILDIGFGLGLNTAYALTKIMESSFKGSVHLFSLEKEADLISAFPLIPIPKEVEKGYEFLSQALPKGKFTKDSFSFQLLLGPAEETIFKLKGLSFDAIFLDPFSPPKNPELWTETFFKSLFELLSPEGILSTYSSAIKVRLNLMKAGFCIGCGPKVGGKGSGTLASKFAHLPPFSDKYWRKIQRRFFREFGFPYPK